MDGAYSVRTKYVKPRATNDHGADRRARSRTPPPGERATTPPRGDGGSRRGGGGAHSRDYRRANSQEEKERAQKRWKKIKHGIAAQNAFKKAGKEKQRRESGAGLGGGGGGGNRKGSRIHPEGGKLKGRIEVSPKGGRAAGGMWEKPSRADRHEAEVMKNAKILKKPSNDWKKGISNMKTSMIGGDLTNCSHITRHILVGNRESARDANGLQELGVTHVLNGTSQLPNFHPHKFVYLKIDMLDAPETPIVSYQKKASKFIQHIEEKGGRVLVHCVAGCSRSVCLVLMHLMVHHGVYLRDGWEHMKSVRPQMNPNEGFKLALAKLEVQIFGATTMANCQDKLWDFYGWNAIKSSYPKRQSRKEQQSACVIL